jgi:hypothetical protein
MGVVAFNRHRFDLLNLHKDIDRLFALTTTISSEDWHPEMKKVVDNAKAIYDQILSRCAAATLSPEEESVIDLKLNRAKSRLSFLGERCG